MQRRQDTFTIEVRNKAVVISIQRLKPAIISSNDEPYLRKDTEQCNNQAETEATERQTETTRSGRKVRFKKDADYTYF